ncbi:hypothetical protein [Burkholderia diffusa]|uniref:hypothetical protein n=1 Tax=Burkholderia diffusa TaxID=488732 RepID=UPI001589F6E8|nr:hypothetical protein [Burkholderia diffusa]
MSTISTGGNQLRAMSPFGQLTVFHLVPCSTLQLLDWDRLAVKVPRAADGDLADQTRVLREHWHVPRGASGGERAAPANAAKRVQRAMKTAARRARLSVVRWHEHRHGATRGGRVNGIRTISPACAPVQHAVAARRPGCRR